MEPEIKLFHAQFETGDYHAWLLPILENFFINAKKNEIKLALTSKQIYDAIQSKGICTLALTTDALKARLEIKIDTIKFYLEPPLQMKLHKDEKSPSPDYLAYLELFLALLKDIPVVTIETSEELYSYR